MLKDFINQQSIVDFKRNHVELDLREYGNIKIEQDIITYNDKVYTAIKPQPTFDECIKKWEERGWKVWYKDGNGFDLHKSLLERISIYIPEQSYFSTVTLSFELHNLLTKTLKALENNNETK